jgi:hypothetical protein
VTGVVEPVLVARALRGAWRVEPPLCRLNQAELDRLAPVLVGTRAGGLGWRAIQSRPDLLASPAAATLADTYRLNVLHAGLQRTRLDDILGELAQRTQLTPLLVKGWSIARLYPDAGARPCGDIDLVVASDRVGALEAALSQIPRAQEFPGVDIDHLFIRVDRSSVAELLDRARLIRLGKHQVCILSPEDTLRLSCVHFLLDGGWRAQSLCDIGLQIETAGVDFDWELALGRDRRRREWILTTLALSAKVLGADTAGTPAAGYPVPRWVLRQVQERLTLTPDARWRPLFRPTLNPASVLAQLRVRRADLVEASIHLRRGVTRHPPIHLLPREIGRRMSGSRRSRESLARLTPEGSMER